MNWDEIEGKWKQLKGSIKERWGRLTDDDLDVIAGKRDRLVGVLQERYGILQDEAEREADAWIDTARFTEEPRETRRRRRPAA